MSFYQEARNQGLSRTQATVALASYVVSGIAPVAGTLIYNNIHSDNNDCICLGLSLAAGVFTSLIGGGLITKLIHRVNERKLVINNDSSAPNLRTNIQRI